MQDAHAILAADIAANRWDAQPDAARPFYVAFTGGKRRVSCPLSTAEAAALWIANWQDKAWAAENLTIIDSRA